MSRSVALLWTKLSGGGAGLLSAVSIAQAEVANRKKPAKTSLNIFCMGRNLTHISMSGK
jgi:hypothetical protein